MKKKLLLMIQIVVSAILLAFQLGSMEMEEVVLSVRAVNLGYYGAAIVLSCLFVIAGAAKWSYLAGMGLSDGIRLSYIARFYAAILPGQMMGEAAKALYSKRYMGSVGRSAASVLVDKATSFLGIFVLGFAGALADRFNLRMALIFMVFLLAGILGFLFFRRIYSFFIKGQSGQNNPNRVLGRLFRLVHVLEPFIEDRRKMFNSILFGIGCQALGIGAHYCVLLALGIRIPFPAMMWIFAVISVALFIPISVAGLGVREASYIGLLLLYGIGKEEAMAVSFLIFILGLFGGMIGAVFTLAQVKDQWKGDKEVSQNN